MGTWVGSEPHLEGGGRGLEASTSADGAVPWMA
jgi:hypothetical protein